MDGLCSDTNGQPYFRAHPRGDRRAYTAAVTSVLCNVSKVPESAGDSLTETVSCPCNIRVMPQSHPTTGPVRFLSPVRFLAVRPSEAPVGILRRCCSRGHIRLRAPYDLTRTVHLWFGRITLRIPWVPRAGPARKSSMFFISYGTRTGPVRDPQGCRTAALRTRKGIDTTRIGKTPARVSYLAVRGP